MMLILMEGVLFLCLSMMVLAQQPLMMGSFLLFYCFLASVLVYSFFSSWFSMSLFLIYIGGMLVLFGYVLVLTPNFVFSFKGIIFIFFGLVVGFFSPEGEVALETMSFSLSFFSYSNLVVYLSLAVFLFIGLVSVAKICFFQVGAFRPFFLFYV